MSVDRLTALEHRLAVLERHRRSSFLLAVTGCSALALAGLIPSTQAQGTSQVRAPFSVVNAAGQEIFSVTQAGSDTRVNIVDKGQVVATWSASDDGASLTLGGTKAKGFARLAVNFDGAGTGPSLLMAKSNSNVLRVEDDSVEISAPLTVLPKDDKPAFRVQENLVTAIGELTVRSDKGNNRTSLDATKLSIHGADAAVAASLGLDAAGKGRLAVGAPNGVRAVLGHPQAGGISFTLWEGAAPRLSMLAATNSSTLGVYSGKRSAELNAGPSSSHLNMHNDEGYAAVSLVSSGAGSGHLMLGNAAGDTTVEAGMTNEGLGVVRAGPRMGGVVGFEGSLPWAILGKKQR